MWPFEDGPFNCELGEQKCAGQPIVNSPALKSYPRDFSQKPNSNKPSTKMSAEGHSIICGEGEVHVQAR